MLKCYLLMSSGKTQYESVIHLVGETLLSHSGVPIYHYNVVAWLSGNGVRHINKVTLRWATILG